MIRQWHGARGLCVLLADGREVIDLITDLHLSAVIVARSSLGTLDHTALTVEPLRARCVAVGIVPNEHTGGTPAEHTPGVISAMTGVSVETLPPLSLDKPGDTVAGVNKHLSDSMSPPLPPGSGGVRRD